MQILQAHGPVHGIDVLADPDVRDGIKEYTRWPTIPQVFIHGKFVGGSDIVRELEERGELKALIDATPLRRPERGRERTTRSSGASSRRG